MKKNTTTTAKTVTAPKVKKADFIKAMVEKGTFTIVEVMKAAKETYGSCYRSEVTRFTA